MENHNIYISPFSTRYADKEMQYLFSDDFKFKTWRKLWLALAESEKELGLNISDDQINELRNNVENINFDVAIEKEKEIRHDVMSHVYAYGVQCPKAKPIIHLGATSCFVGDNTDIIIQKEALQIILKKLVNVIRKLSVFACNYASLPTLAYTHLQPAQPTTVGKRATLWINDFVLDLKDLEYRINNLELRGCKGTTGTQASFLELFDGDVKKVFLLDDKLTKKMGFRKSVDVCGQTYSRKVDFLIQSTLSSIAQSSYKFASDLRMLQAFKEIEEPFEKHQVGSSAMPYKRNPMRCERICGLARYIIVNLQNLSLTASSQWFERTLDDSANRRISIAEGFLATDAVLNLLLNVTGDLVVYDKVILNRLKNELPFMTVENIMMDAVKHGGDRQLLHEKIRSYSQETAYGIKMNGQENDLIEKIKNDPDFYLTEEALHDLLNPSKYIGLAKEQTNNFLEQIVNPILERHNDLSDENVELSV